MVTCVTPCQCLTLLSDPIEKSRKMQLPAAKASMSVCLSAYLSVCLAKASGPRPKKCWLLTPHPPVSACRMVTCVTPCQCLTLLSDPIEKSRKRQLPAAKESQSVYLSVCLFLCLARGQSRSQSQRSKTQKMLAPNASSPWQRVSNGYLCHPLPVPNVAF